jgi:hypothetical protein
LWQWQRRRLAQPVMVCPLFPLLVVFLASKYERRVLYVGKITLAFLQDVRNGCLGVVLVLCFGAARAPQKLGFLEGGTSINTIYGDGWLERDLRATT